MTYPGNPSLTADVQQRILTTYRQSVQSAARGSRDEALLGCDFVLRLDPQFRPARNLQQMLAANREPAAYEQLLVELDGGAPAASGAPAARGDLRASFTQLLAERRFAELLNAAERDKRIIATDPALAELVEQAQGRYEAEPYVLKFADAAAAKLAAGDRAEAERLLEKARSLDPTHPRIAEVSDAVAAAGTPAPAPQAPAELPALDFGSFELPSAEDAGFGSFDLEASEPTATPADGAARPPEETSGRIVSLLSEGQAAFDRGEYQAAIDAWSRIFLIDIDHDEAARKIERARQLKAEKEREVEEIFHEGVARFDAGELAASREAFRRVLEIQPSYALAREYLDKLDEREAGGALPGAGLPELAPLPAEPAGAARPEPRRGASEAGAPASAPERRRAAVGPSYVAASKRPAGGPSPRLLLLGGGVLALLAVGGWFVFSQRERLFPNAAEPAAAAPAAADPLEAARKLHGEGKTAVAIAQLKRLPPSHPAHAEAQALIAQWESIPAPGAAPAVDTAAIARRRELLERAQAALADGENFRARRFFRAAAELAPLDGDWITMSATAEERLAPLGPELDRFRDGDYEYLINALWRRREAEPSNRDVQRMLVDAYHNLGVLDLQRGDPAGAREKFREARGIDATDSEIQRLERFATTYENRAQDLLYRIFVKYAPMR
jgi:tetratricopeptide (TPR) repeat protein